MRFGDFGKSKAFELRDLGVLEGPPDHDLDVAVTLAARATRSPIATFAALDFDAGLSRIRAHVGLEPNCPDVAEIPLTTAITWSMKSADALLIVPDTAKDDRTAVHPFMRAYGLQSLLAAPVLCPAHEVVALLAVHDRVPRLWTDAEQEAVSGLAHFCTQMILLRAALRTIGILSRMAGSAVR